MKLNWWSSTFLAWSINICLATSVQPIGEWTISDTFRVKTQDSTICNWQFHVADSSQGSDAINAFDCEFDVTADSGTDCATKSFQTVCSSNDSFSINGGHSSMGFIVMVLVNVDQKSEAYFGFSDDALDSGSEISKQTKPVYPQGVTPPSSVSARQDGGNTTEWTVEDLFRVIDDERRTVTVGFRIQDGSIGGSSCMLSLMPPDGVDINSWEWYNQPCEGSGYSASWGYMATGDAGIMTIVNSTRNGQAFFGFSNIKSSTYLGDAGPSPVSPCNCG
ncbi:uncharacterized protein F4822DRAFT_164080 [Hypoxylon trugodes]|uniref:uncharacterized protein n=1 Tax=Hypoxylon trugodes TaxID=326681 RepID=UPI00219FE6AF|nr:uncharacterized protein F4822DRAFT_164080 [Hypoxylon trugodes]KAI1390824.1 hypothetical protein F4822DRAFT_164080 [Hypoxylon trugodes]